MNLCSKNDKSAGRYAETLFKYFWSIMCLQKIKAKIGEILGYTFDFLMSFL